MKKSTALWLLIALLLGPVGRADFFFPQPPNYVGFKPQRRNHLFFVGETPVFAFVTASYSGKPTWYEVRNYWGDLVASGVPGQTAPQISLPGITTPGWYKLYVYQDADQGAPWGKIIGGTFFSLFRNDPNFPALPAVGASIGGDRFGDEAIRGVAGIGPQRIRVQDLSDPDTAIAAIQATVDVDKAMYLPYDPVRKRALMVSVPDGVASADGSKLANLKRIVTTFKDDVTYWEGLNEPQNLPLAQYLNNELIPFYNTVKSVDPGLKVLGPAVVSLKNIDWINSFLDQAGNHFDAFSFHAYNNLNGDLGLARRCLTDLKTALHTHGRDDTELWQTEQGYFAAIYGSYQPRHQSVWTMLQMMVFEQYGIPKEHNHYWYDVSGGYWVQPTFFEYSDNSLGPIVPLLRVWSEELYGTLYQSAYAFGPEEKQYLGSLFAGSGKSVAAFMSAGTPYGSLTLAVSGGDTLHTVSAFGVTTDLPVTGGVAILPVSELPVYVEMSPGQSISVLPRALSENVARRPGVSFLVNGAPDANTPKLVNGVLDNWYYKQYTGIPGTGSTPDPGTPWRIPFTTSPTTVEMDLPAAETISDVVIYAAVPWQFDSTLVDYDLQYWDGAAWQTIETVTEPTKTWKVFSFPVRCTVDSFFSDRCIFDHHFAPLTTSKLRLNIRNVTYGGGATVDVMNAGGQSLPQQVVIREWEVYRATAPVLTTAPQDQTAAAGASISLHTTLGNAAGATFQWQCNGADLPGATDPTLDLPNLTLDSAGTYAVTVTNSVGSTSSGPAAVLVETPFTRWAAGFYAPADRLQPRALLLAPSANNGLATILNYFFGFSPKQGLSAADTSALPASTLDLSGPDPYLVLSFALNPLATDLTWVPEGADDVNGPWQTVTPETTTTGDPDPVTGRATVTLRFPLSSLSARCFRLRVGLP